MLRLTITVSLDRLSKNIPPMPISPKEPTPEQLQELEKKRQEQLRKALLEHIKKHPSSKPDLDAVEQVKIDVPPKTPPAKEPPKEDGGKDKS